MKRFHYLFLGLVMGLAATTWLDQAQAACKSVNGHLTSQVVLGPACLSPIGFCTEGSFNGGIKGDFFYEALQFIPNPDSTGANFITGVIVLTTADGILIIDDATVASSGADGFGASVLTITEGTDDLVGATGRLRSIGVFIDGCIDCDYKGEFCTP